MSSICSSMSSKVVTFYNACTVVWFVRGLAYTYAKTLEMAKHSATRYAR